VLAGDTAGVARCRAHAGEARARRPGLISWAAARRKTGAIRTLVELGFDINALARSDVPAEEAWESGRLVAAGNGEVELARLLLVLGADPDLLGAQFDSTPLGWARLFGHDATIALLEPVTH
jgi:hypothetical protein